MKTFTSVDGIEIAWYEWGYDTSRPPVVLHHGFAASAAANWEAPAVVAELVTAGRKVYALDARGHGRSGKPHDKAFYGETKMSRDLSQFLDVIGAPQVDLAGYSMGGIVVLINATTERRIRRLIAGGIGGGVVMFGGVDQRAIGSDLLAAGLLAADKATLFGPVAAFRAFAESTGADLKALAAQAQSVHREAIALGQIKAPTLILAGDNDPLAAWPDKLAAAIPDAVTMVIPGTHLGVVGTAAFRRAIVDFFAV
ncbi:2-succinyl-6-hydroxy-2, 4-cyclohexadiene-1-carboxylate synthase [Alphaproteobacteria bacterium SO-S41]|nr:2-succinyl-6-hydroxy-2, 4-cyclohexadiene-1-carboxylate synthase [Alphaproteobacteria bacterium SO-S41]